MYKDMSKNLYYMKNSKNLNSYTEVANLKDHGISKY